MKRKIAACCMLVVLCSPLLLACQGAEYPGRSLRPGRHVEKINDAVAEAIREGKVQRMMPPASVMIAGVMVPITAIAGFFVFLVVYARLQHRKSMAMIEKGIYTPPKWRWDQITLFIGLLLMCVGVGVSLTTAGFCGPEPWTLVSGSIPFLLGIAFLLFYRFCKHEG
jgi:hypothetical protein